MWIMWLISGRMAVANASDLVAADSDSEEKYVFMVVLQKQFVNVGFS